MTCKDWIQMLWQAGLATLVFLAWLYQQRWLSIRQARGNALAQVARASSLLHQMRRLTDIAGEGSMDTGPLWDQRIQASAELPAAIREIAIALEIMLAVSHTSVWDERQIRFSFDLLQAHAILFAFRAPLHTIDEALSTVDEIGSNLREMKFDVFPRIAGRKLMQTVGLYRRSG